MKVLHAWARNAFDKSRELFIIQFENRDDNLYNKALNVLKTSWSEGRQSNYYAGCNPGYVMNNSGVEGNNNAFKQVVCEKTPPNVIVMLENSLCYATNYSKQYDATLNHPNDVKTFVMRPNCNTIPLSH